jgi:glutathione S-transferase
VGGEIMSDIKIYSARVCPYAQRSRMVLETKGLAFELIEIDLQNKPDWFLEISPYGKVPVLQYGDEKVWESAVINEYIEEVFPEPALMPATPLHRAQVRIWIDFANTKFTPAFYKLLLAQETLEQQEWAEELHKHLIFIEQEGLQKLSANGPYWLGNFLSLLDFSYYPWFERWAALEHYRSIKIPAECSRLLQWIEVMKSQPAVQKTLHPPAFHIEQYAKYANNTTSGVTAQEIRRY